MRPIWLVIFGTGTLLLQAGFALQASGSLRAKNASAAIVRLLANIAAAALAFWAVGAAILFQTHHPWLGFDNTLLFRQPPELAASEFFHMTIFLIGGAMVTGAIAERAKFYVGVIASALLGGLVFPIAGHWVWFGKLRDWNFIDFGGASVIHLSAAVFAAVGVAVIGSRAGKYESDGSSNSIAGHSLPMLGAGVLLLLAGWFPYLLGCVSAHWFPVSSMDEVILAISATNILLAGMGGVAGGLLYSQYRYGKPDLFFVYSGLLGALVAISPGFPGVTSGGAIAIGFVAGVLVPIGAIALDVNARIDDPIGLIAIHGIGALWGTLATALFVSTLNFSDHFKLLAIQSGGLALIMVLAAVAASVLFVILRAVGALRVNITDELEGMDLADHAVHSYPESQRDG